MKTARFSSVVAACGTPSPHLAWVAPEKDPAFQSALKADRVMTLHQELRGGKKDHGEVGYNDAPHAQYLIFPKSLRAFEDLRIVGIDYELFAKDPDPLPEPEEPATIPARNAERSSKRAPERSKKQKAARATPVDPEADEGSDRSNETAEREDSHKETRASIRTLSNRTETEEHAPASAALPSTAPETSLRSGEPADRRRTLAEVERVLRDLKRGKAVAAYERLKALAERLKTSLGAK